jgi:hypothetical protein
VTIPQHTTLAWGFLVTCTKAEKRPTLYEESNIDPPYTDCNCRSDLISVPNGNASNLNEQLIWGRSVVKDVHAKNNQ